MFCRQCGTRMDDAARFCPSCGQPTDLAVQPVYAPPPVPIQPQPQPVHAPPSVPYPSQPQPVFATAPEANRAATSTSGGSGTVWYLAYGFLFVLSMVLLIFEGIPFKWALCMFLLFAVFCLVLVLAVKKGAAMILRIASTLFPVLVVAVTIGAALLGWLRW